MEYSDDFSRSVAKESFWYLDTAARTEIAEDNAAYNEGYAARRTYTATAADVKVIILLNRYSFFEELEDKMLVPMQLQFIIQLNNDNELIHRDHNAAAGRVVIHTFYLWLRKLLPKDSMYNQFVR